MIYLHENFKYKLKLELNNYTTWEVQCIEIMRGKTLNQPLYIGNIYRPPRMNLLIFFYIYCRICV